MTFPGIFTETDISIDDIAESFGLPTSEIIDFKDRISLTNNELLISNRICNRENINNPFEWAKLLCKLDIRSEKDEIIASESPNRGLVFNPRRKQ